jgi:RNA polymerase sigma-70 factor (ECF subfamily)
MLKDENREEAEAAFNEFHHRHAEFLWRAINKYFSILSEHEKREIINETFIVIWNLAEKYDDSRAKPSTWLFAIAKNKARDMLRRKSRIVEDSVDSLDFHDPQRDDFWREQGMEPQEESMSRP